MTNGNTPGAQHVTRALPVQRAGQLESPAVGQRWLIRSVWGRSDVGILGGPPKSCKSYLGLELATSVATGIPALGHFPVESRGRALVYFAEDALPLIRSRLEAICDFRNVDIRQLDLHVICSPVLRLDLRRDQLRLVKTLDEHRPRLLLLDPLVRLHRLDENSSTEISGLLGFYGSATHLQVCKPVSLPEQRSPPLDERILALLAATDGPMSRTTIRNELRVNNNRLGQTLEKLQSNGLLNRSRDGWSLPPQTVVDPSPKDPQQALFD